ncbi:autotransporter domain-containing protein [Tistrella sp. BH-R2-4]|uniref:Autotransporter domain-containing protein n=1 Tax=Tistrella arctica TaxID=3133430 RepID=A0ABU9YDP8_9PROT
MTTAQPSTGIAGRPDDLCLSRTIRHGRNGRARIAASLAVTTALAGALAGLAAGVSPARADQPGGVMTSVDLIGARALWERGITGQGTMVVVIDSGVEASHPFLRKNVVEEACVGMSVGGVSADCGNGTAFATGAGTASPDYDDEDAAHGTHVAGTVAGNNGEAFGVAPDAMIAAIRMASPEGLDEEAGCGSDDPDCAVALNGVITRAYDHVAALAAQYRVVAVNMSLGAGEYSGICDETTPGGAETSAAFQGAAAANIASIVSSGNEYHTTTVSTPACLTGAVPVGAVDNNLIIADFSNQSDLVELMAPGVDVVSSVYNGGYAPFSGTSMAAPHVAGAVALLASASPGASLGEILSALQLTGTDVTYDDATLSTRIDEQGQPVPQKLIFKLIQVDKAAYLLVSARTGAMGTAADSARATEMARSFGNLLADGYAADPLAAYRALDVVGRANIDAALAQLGPDRNLATAEASLALLSEIGRTVSGRLGGLRAGTAGTAGLDIQRQFAAAATVMSDATSGSGGIGALARLPGMEGAETGAWVRGFGQWLDRDGTAERDSFRASGGGVVAGIDMAAGDGWRLGGFMAYGRSNTRTDGGLGEGTVDLASLGAYGGYSQGRYHLDGSLSVGYGWGETDRTIALPGLLRTATAETDGLAVQSRVAMGATYDVAGWVVGPELWLGYAGIAQKGYTETGAGSLNATVDDLWLGEIGTGLGLTVGRQFDLGGPVLMPAVTLGMGYRSPTGDDTMSGSLGGGSAGAFALDMARDNELTFDPAVEVALGIDASTSAFASWRGRFGDGVADNAGTVGVRITW